MRTLLILLALIVAAAGGYAFKEFAVAEDPAPPAAAATNQAEIDQAISQYLKQHPEEVLAALQLAQVQAEQKQQADAVKSLADRRAEIFNNPADPVLGNPQADVTVVEFFDYRCPYCKKVSDALLTLAKDDPKLRVVYKEFPILGPDSLVASQVALAAQKQGKYHEVHEALMAHKGSFEKAALLEVAANAGADRQRLSADMEDPAILEQLQKNDALAASLGITGTPGFIFNNKLVPGAISLEDMKNLVSEIRAQAG
jgi:protein-disulfide isomerase